VGDEKTGCGAFRGSQKACLMNETFACFIKVR
jgi:hypothetical protein